MNKIDKIKGCLIGGAVGDALGYPIEFLKYELIIKKYGNSGLGEYVLENGKALISDDTQLTLFTAIGLLNSLKQGKKLDNKTICNYVYYSYLDWLKTQGYQPQVYPKTESILDNVSELKNQRAPGNTCLSALLSGKLGTIEKPLNDSFGCGGIMRSAPCAILFPSDYKLSAETTAITHGHILAYLPSELFHFIIANLLNNDKESSLLKILNNGIKYISNKYIRKITLTKIKKMQRDNCKILVELLKTAIALSQDNIEDNKSLSVLGLGFVAHEALAIAVYSCLKYENDFEKAIICSINHDGDSDSTGSITGNILGAKLGYKNIPTKFIKNLELHNLICEVAEMLNKSSN